MSAFRHVWLLLFCLLAACASLKDFDAPVVELAGIKPLAPEGFEQRDAARSSCGKDDEKVDKVELEDGVAAREHPGSDRGAGVAHER